MHRGVVVGGPAFCAVHTGRETLGKLASSILGSVWLFSANINILVNRVLIPFQIIPFGYQGYFMDLRIRD